MRLRRRDMEVMSQCSETEFSLTGKEREETIGGLALFKYLGRPLEQSDNDWLSVRQNTRRSHQFWGRLGVILRREGVEPTTSVAFYREVVQAVICFWAEMWVLSAATEKRIAGLHTGFFRQATGKNG